jgi:hypothetical protein
MKYDIIYATDLFPSSVGRYSWEVRINYTNGNLIYQIYGRVFYEYEGVTTIGFCNSIGLSDEDTMLWILKYGTFLPSNFEEL